MSHNFKGGKDSSHFNGDTIKSAVPFIRGIEPKNSQIDPSESEIVPNCENTSSEVITVAVFKCRSLKNKIPEFHHLIHSTKCNVIIGTEYWLTDDDSVKEIFPKSFTVYQ